MFKKILVFALIVILSLYGSSAIVYASPNQLENQGETESTAGITMDQINEMSQNSPNSLTPIQGLVLWMFAILAFLKLAQKMDSLLQSLGLNVTQTGGRAVGDLVMAGMALKHIGSAFSKGMGMFGLGKSGGSSGSASGTGSGTGTRNAGSPGPAPIPTGSPGSNPGGGSHGRTSPNVASPTGTAPSTQGPGSRNPVGKFAGWMGKDGFAQGAIKAGAKGGVIGVGAYGVKTGVSKIGSAVSARFNGDGISSDPKGTAPNNQQPIDANKNGNNDVHGTNTKNPEGYQTTKPLDGSEDRSLIPTTANSEDYQDANPFDNTEDSSSALSFVNEEGYVASHDIVSDGQTIPATTESVDGDASETSESTANSSSGEANNEKWQSARPVDGSGITAPIPATINNEGWNDSIPINQPINMTSTVSDSSAIVSQSPAAKPVTQDAAVIQAGVTPNTTVPNSAHIQHGTVASMQDTGSTQHIGTGDPSSVGTVIQQGTPPIISSQINESGSSYENDVATTETLPLSQGSATRNNSETSYEPTPMPAQNQAIPSGHHQSIAPSSDMPASENVVGGESSLNLTHHAPIQSSNSAINIDSSTTSEVIRMDLPSSVSVHGAGTVSANSSVPVQDASVQTNPATQPFTPVVHIEKQGYNPQPASQPTTANNDTSTRPAEKDKSKTSAARGRKRRR